MIAGATPSPGLDHVFSVDVEEYFHVNGFDGVIDRNDWHSFESRVAIGVHRLLELLGDHRATATFFTLGLVAEHSPELVRLISEAGHEVASHGYMHRRVQAETPSTFRDDVRRSKALLEDTTGRAVLGYRAPSFSITKETEWALDVLVEEGYSFDSSRFPISRAGYGSPHVSLDPHVVHTGSGPILELPLTVLSAGPLRLPAAGGGWFRQFPFLVTSLAFRRLSAQRRTGMFYIHPWELDDKQPRLPVGWMKGIRHYRGIDTTQARLARLLSQHRFGSVAHVHSEALSAIQMPVR